MLSARRRPTVYETHGDEDAGIHEYFAESAFPSQGDIDDILVALRQSSLGFTEKELEERCNIRAKQIAQVILYTCVQLEPKKTKPLVFC